MSTGTNAAATAAAPMVLFIGRPNSGKTSLYNAITGANAHVGNFPGITVDVLEASIELAPNKPATLIDLPGIYSLNSELGAAADDAETDEGIARAFLRTTRESGAEYLVVQIIDATRLALGLGLTEELAAAGERFVIAVSQVDELHKQNEELRVEEIARSYDVPVAVMSARDPAAEKSLRELIGLGLALPNPQAAGAPSSTDSVAAARIRRTSAAAIVPRASTIKSQAARTFTTRVDAWTLHPVLGPLLFLAIMGSLFAAVFLIADPATALADTLAQQLAAQIVKRFGHGILSAFVGEGLVGGAGTVLAFLPQIVLLSLAMEFLDANGYLPRGAFLLDRLLRGLGLSGRSFLPLLMGHACAIPAIASTRIIRDPRERLTTILVLPLMTCSARIPTYALLLSTFFGHRSALFRAGMFVLLYLIGLLSGLAAGLVLRRTATRGRSLPFIMEMPAYRTPQWKPLFRHVARSATRFMKDVGTTVVAASAVLWVLLNVPMPFAKPQVASVSAESAEIAQKPIERSIAAVIGKSLEPVTKAAGFDWRINVGLLGSFGARELMVGTLGVIMGVEGANEDPAPLSDKLRQARKADGTPVYSTRTALALLAFFVLACQCLSTLAAVRRETKTWRWPLFVLGYTYALAYVAAVLVYQVSGLFGVA